MSYSPSAQLPRRWGTVEDAAAEACVSTKTLRRQIARGDVYAERISARRIRVDLNTVAGRPLSVARSAR